MHAQGGLHSLSSSCHWLTDKPFFQPPCPPADLPCLSPSPPPPAVLTVRAHTAASHGKKGWEKFTDGAISQLSQQRHGIVFLLWGRYAQVRAEQRAGGQGGRAGGAFVDLQLCAGGANVPGWHSGEVQAACLSTV